MVALIVGNAALAADAQGQDVGDAAFLFAYTAKPHMNEAFERGYRRHLDWHAEHGDSLTWLAWTVVDGRGVGTFVDGTFGVPFEAFDDRVDPRGDAEDGAKNITTFADPLYREVYRLRRDLGSAVRLEAGRPARMQRVVRLTLRPGAREAFEQALSELELKNATALDYAVYERVSGGGQPGFMLIVQFTAWADLEDAGSDPGRAILRAAGSTVTRAESEVWLYRPGLAYFPGDGRTQP